MTKKEFFEKHRDVPDDALIVVACFEHMYRVALSSSTTALQNHHDLTEDYGEEHTPEADFGKRIPIILID